MDILILSTHLCLCARSINRLLKPLTLPQLRPVHSTNLHPMHRALLLVLGPRGAGDVAPHDGLDGKYLQSADLHAAAAEMGEGIRGERGGELRRECEGEEVGLERGDVGGEVVEPEGSQAGEDAAFGGDALRRIREQSCRWVSALSLYSSRALTTQDNHAVSWDGNESI